MRHYLIFILLAINHVTFGNQIVSRFKAVYQSSAIDYNQTGHLITDESKDVTYWQSKSNKDEWIYIDLGSTHTIDSIRIYWGNEYATNYSLQTGNYEGQPKTIHWKTVLTRSKNTGGIVCHKIKPTRARYVKIYCKISSGQSFIIYHVDVFGQPLNPPQHEQKNNIFRNNTLYIRARWKIKKVAFETHSPEELCSPTFDDSEWLEAEVPGTVLASYLKAGAIPDPNYGDQQLMISDAYFTAPFYYRTVFKVPDELKNKKLWLNFDGVNYAADYYLNGKKIGYSKGAFCRTRININNYLNPSEENVLLVKVYPNEHPGEVTEQHLNDPDPNGGIIGLDGPTFLASIGWNWIPTIRGRNTGIWNKVYLSGTGPVTLEQPFVRTSFPLPDTSQSTADIECLIINHSDMPVEGKLTGTIDTITFNTIIKLKANDTVRFSKQVLVLHPKLWWPNGYGNPYLYRLKLSFTTHDMLSDEKVISFGFRQFTYQYQNSNLRLYIIHKWCTTIDQRRQLGHA